MFHPIVYAGSIGQLRGLLVRTLGDWQANSVYQMAGGLVQAIAIGILLICMLVIVLSPGAVSLLRTAVNSFSGVKVKQASDRLY